MGLTWAVGWGFVGALMGLWQPGGVAPLLFGTAAAGFLCGGTFSVVLGLAGRRRSFEEMSLQRFAGFGGSATLLAYLATVVYFSSPGSVFTPTGLMWTTFWALLGAGSAAGSLALARRADDRELLDAGAEVAEVGLTKEEKRELLGK